MSRFAFEKSRRLAAGHRLRRSIQWSFMASSFSAYVRFFRRGLGWTAAQASRNLLPSTGTRRTVTFPLLIEVILTIRFPIIYLRLR